MDLSTVVRAIDTWSIEDRLQLIDCLWKSLVATGWQPEMTDEAEITLAEHRHDWEADPTEAQLWDQLERAMQREI